MSTVWPTEHDIEKRLGSLAGMPVSLNPPFVVEWSGTAFRFASREYVDIDHFTNGEGAKKFGGRFTPIGGQKTVYLSLDRRTALAELDSYREYYDLPDSTFEPRVLAGAAVCVGLLLDLSLDETLEEISIGREALLEEWRPECDAGRVAQVQAFGRIAFETGFEGIMFPSARNSSGINLALFPENYRAGSHAIILGTH